MASTQFQRRKIFWHSTGLSATIDFGSRDKPDKQEVRWFHSRSIEHVGDGEFRDVSNWLLSWDGMLADTFTSREGLLLFLIRVGYHIEEGRMIPSEILFDAGLRYFGEGWIDSWSELDHGDRSIVVIDDPSEIEAPKERKIRLEPYIHVSRGTQTQVRQTRSYPNKITHMDLEEIEYTPRERIRFRDIGPEWEDPCPWYKKSYVRPRAELISKYHQEEDEGEEITRRLRAALAVHSSD